MIVILVMVVLTIVFYLVSRWSVPSNPPYRVGDMVKHGCKKACYIMGLCRLNKSVAWQNLLSTTDTLESKGIPYVISEGTALGLVRDGDIIAYDDDVDIVVPKEHKSAFLSEAFPELIDQGFVTCKSWRHGDLLTMCRGGVSVDINFIAEDSTCEWGPSGNIFPCPVETILLNTRRMNFKDRSLTLPSDHYLEVVYGSSWRTPKHRLN